MWRPSGVGRQSRLDGRLKNFKAMLAPTRKTQCIGDGMTLGLIIAGTIILLTACLFLLLAMLYVTRLVGRTRKALALHDNAHVISELRDEETARTALQGKLALWFMAILPVTVIYLAWFGPVLLFAAMLPRQP